MRRKRTLSLFIIKKVEAFRKTLGLPRPTSLLQIFMKAVEKIIYRALISYFCQNNSFSDAQSCYL